MEQIKMVGLDVAKAVFQVHGVDGEPSTESIAEIKG